MKQILQMKESWEFFKLEKFFFSKKNSVVNSIMQ